MKQLVCVCTGLRLTRCPSCDVANFLQLLCRAIAAETSKKEVQRTVLGVVQPGDTIPVPYGWHRAGTMLHMLFAPSQATLECM